MSIEAKILALAVVLLLGATPAFGSRASTAGEEIVTAPTGSLIYERITKKGRWLESRNLFGGSRWALTPKPAPGAIRRDCCARWSPDGATVAFFRRTPRLLGLYLVAADGSQLHQLVSSGQLQRWIMKPISLGAIAWAPDGSKLLFTVDLLHSCDSDGIYRVNADGSDLRPLWRRPANVHAGVYLGSWSPDGTQVLYDLSRNDGDCYGSHIGPETLSVVTDEDPPRDAQLFTTDAFGDASWSPDGSRVAYTSCAEGDPCNVGIVNPNSRKTHLLTHYKTYTSPYGGFDSLPFLWSGPTALILGRSLSLLSLDETTGRAHVIVSAPCPRTNARCPHSRITLYGVSPGGDAVFDAEDVGCLVCRPPSYGPKPVARRYAVGLADRQLVPLPDPGLPVDDSYLP